MASRMVKSIRGAGVTSAVDSMGRAGMNAVDNMGKAGIKAVSDMSKSSLNIVDAFLSEMEPKSTVIRSLSKGVHEVVPEGSVNKRAFQLYTNVYWQMFMNVSILLNAVQIGLDVEVTGKTADDVWTVCDYVFTVIFAVEMIVALLALRLKYFSNPWNYLDFTVANIAIINTFILPLVDKKKDSGGLSVFRVFRLLRLIRIGKMLKVVPELMMVVQGLISSIKAMVWIFLLLVLFLYTAGIFCKETIGGPDAGYSAYSEEVMEDKLVVTFNNYLYFGSIARSMQTLFNMVILAEWQEVLRPVAEHQPAMVFFFIFVVFLCSFGVLNVMVGIAVEHTTSAIQEQRDEQVLQAQKHQIKLASKLADMVFTFDLDNDERISQAELEHPENAQELHAIIGDLGLPHGYSLEELFEMLDVDGNGFLSKLEFVQGIMRLIYCDQFQRDCLFRTAIGQVKHAIIRSEEQMKQSFEKQLREMGARIFSAVKEVHQTELSAAFDIDSYIAEKVETVAAKEDTGFLWPEHSRTSQAVNVSVVEATKVNFLGQWDELASPEILVVDAAEVSTLGGQVESDIRKSEDVKDANLGTSGVMNAFSDPRLQKQVTWDALRKSLLPVKGTDNLFTFDAQVAEEMFYNLSRSYDVMGWMPVVSTKHVSV